VTIHSFVTIAVPFYVAQAESVEGCLDRFGNPLRQQFAERLDAAAFVHFMSINVVRHDGGKTAHLLIEITADGTAEDAIDKFAAALDEPLREALAAANVNPGSSLVKFLSSHCCPVGQGWFSRPGLNFDGTPGHSVTRIRKEHELAQTIGGFLATMRPEPSALATLERVRAKLWADESAKWAFVPEPTPLLGDMPPSGPKTILTILWSAVVTLLWPLVLVSLAAFALIWWLGSWSLGGFATALLVGLVVILAQLGAIYAVLRRKESTDVPEDITPPAQLVEEIMKRESFGAQNHLAAASLMKPGWFRRLTLRAGLWFAGQLAVHFSAPGRLGTTSVIHFARWVLLPRTNQLLFMSNFDGTWERYLEDFIELAARGVTGIWSNTVGFPKTRNLLFGGATDGDRLRRWTRRQQYPRRIWYSAYPRLTVPRVRTNAAIRQGIASARTEQQAADWLSCFGSSPCPADGLRVTEIPTLVFGGLRRLAHSECLFIELADDVPQARAWLSSIEAHISYGDHLSEDAALAVGFSQSGLRKLGLKEDHLATFPAAFQHGNAAPWRSRALGDVETNAPERWIWGGPSAPIDAVMILYTKTADELDTRCEARRAEIENRGHRVVHSMRLAEVPPKPELVREPFGFVDGISDPMIRGVRNWKSERYRNHLVHPGEFVLGYPDNLGFLPSSPTVPAGDDPHHLLPAAASAASGQRPAFSPPCATDPKDFGRNGTFLVVRQLEQDVDGFCDFVDRTAKAFAASDDPRVPFKSVPELREWIGAKLVGRWRQDGTSLVRYPHKPGGTQADNDFLHGEEDPNGLRCPFGAHVRRANPRDSFVPGSPSQLAISNRHRILRVGRKYDPQENLTKPGLIFMCLNADIERQFEFVQETWVLAKSFHGLESEADPVLGRCSGNDVFTVPTPSGPLCLKDLRDFVTVKGGGYFFMPGRASVRWLCQ
jgi:deferrochelatase/peroxidase EfeB